MIITKPATKDYLDNYSQIDWSVKSEAPKCNEHNEASNQSHLSRGENDKRNINTKTNNS
jgi:hypothetical protein